MSIREGEEQKALAAALASSSAAAASASSSSADDALFLSSSAGLVVSRGDNATVRAHLEGTQYSLLLTVESNRLRDAALVPSHPHLHFRPLADLCIQLDDAAFLCSETRSRLRCWEERERESAALQKRHLIFDDGSKMRVTFASGVICTLETGPDYPLGVGKVHLAALDTMGVFQDDIHACRTLVTKCNTLTEAVDQLAARFKK